MRKALFSYILVAVLCLVSSNLTAQTVGYTYKALAAEGCTMKYSVAKQDTAYYIIATVREHSMTRLSPLQELLLAMEVNQLESYLATSLFPLPKLVLQPNSRLAQNNLKA